MSNGRKDTWLPGVRISSDLRDRLERVAERSVASKLSDHIRAALERYVKEEEAAQKMRAPQQ